MSFPMRINYYDRYTVSGRAYRAVSLTDKAISFESDDGGKSTLILTVEQMKKQLKLPEVTLERGYYLSEQMQTREHANVDAIGDLPKPLRAQVLWRLAYCQAFYQLEESGELKRQDASIEQAMPELTAIVHQQERINQFKWKVPRAGQTMQLRTSPCSRTLRIWLKKFETSGGNPIALVPHFHRSGNRNTRFCLESRRLMGQAFETFLTMQRKTKKIVVDHCRIRFREANAERRNLGIPELPIPSRRTIERALSKLDPYFTKVHRYGADQANRECVLWEDGIDASYPLERVEIDEWKVDLITIFAERGALDGLTRKELAEIERGRRWLYVAIDCATRCIVGMRLAKKPNVIDAIATLADITRDKTDIAGAAGCSGDWCQYGGLSIVVEKRKQTLNAQIQCQKLRELRGRLQCADSDICKVWSTVHTRLSSRCQPQQNGFNGSLRDELLNEDLFDTLDDARRKLAFWQYDYNNVRPQSSLGSQTPAEVRRVLEQFEGSAHDALAPNETTDCKIQTRRLSL